MDLLSCINSLFTYSLNFDFLEISKTNAVTYIGNFNYANLIEKIILERKTPCGKEIRSVENDLSAYVPSKLQIKENIIFNFVEDTDIQESSSISSLSLNTKQEEYKQKKNKKSDLTGVSLINGGEKAIVIENEQGLFDEKQESGEADKEDSFIEFNEYLLTNVDNIINNALGYSLIFDEAELLVFKTFKEELNKTDKQILLKFVLSGSIWLRKGKVKFSEAMNISEEAIQNSFGKLQSLKFLSPAKDLIFNNIPFTSNKTDKDCKEAYESTTQFINKREMINFLYFLKNDEIKTILTELKKLTKNLANITKKDFHCEDIFANNPFFRLDEYLDFPLLQTQVKKIQNQVSEFIFNSDKFLNKESKLKPSTLYNPPAFGQKNLNFMNSSNYKKTRIIKFNDSPKVQNIFSIIKTLENFIADKSANMLNNFLSLGKLKADENKSISAIATRQDQNLGYENKIIKDKILKIKKIFEGFNNSVLSLHLKFAKLFDNATQLFFFYSEYNDINDLAKEFYKFENFEKYESFIIDKQLLGKQAEYLKPIFSSRLGYKLFDNINYLKRQYSIHYCLANDLELNYSILKNLFFVLLDIANPDLFKELFKRNFIIPETFQEAEQAEDFRIAYLEMIEEGKNFYMEINGRKFNSNLLNKLYSLDYSQLNDSFISKFYPGYNCCYLLNYFAEIVEKKKEYNVACFIYSYLLLSKYLCKKRGFWWFRLILIYKNYIKSFDEIDSYENCISNADINSKNSPNRENNNKKNNKKSLKGPSTHNIADISLKLLQKSSEDNFIKTGYYEKIKSYYQSFEKALVKENNKTNKNNKHKKSNSSTNNINNKQKIELLDDIKKNFKQLDIDEKAFKYREISADSVYNSLTGKRMYSFNNEVGTVEQYALNYYSNQGYNGVHGENKILPCLYNLFFWEIIYYDKVPYVFQSSYQSYPLDFFSPDFYMNREVLIKKRLLEIEMLQANEIKDYINEIFNKKKNIKTPLVDWNYYMNGKDILVNIAISITGKKLAKIFEEFSKNIRFIIKGMPDLFLWKETSLHDSALLVEVKSLNDKLSDHQKYWLKFLNYINLNNEILHIK